MTFNPEKFATVLRVKRAEMRWKQSDLAKAADVSSAAIFRYEHEEAEPSFPIACRIASALGCSLDEFVDERV